MAGAVLAQNATATIAEAANYVGLLLFVMRAPNGWAAPKWRWLERALPFVGIALALGLPLPMAARSTIRPRLACGMPLSPASSWRCAPSAFCSSGGAVRALGLSAAPLGAVGLPDQATRIHHCRSLADHDSLRYELGDFTPPDDLIGLLYLINGVLCLFVFEAIRRGGERFDPASPRHHPRPYLEHPGAVLHHEVEYMQEHLAIPNRAWIVIGAIFLYVITRLHEGATHLADRYFNRELDRVGKYLGAAILEAKSAAEIERLLADESFRALALTSAAVFRRERTRFRRHGNGNGWDGAEASTLQSTRRCSHRSPADRASPSPARTTRSLLPSRSCRRGSRAPFSPSPPRTHSTAWPSRCTVLMLPAPTSMPMSVPCSGASRVRLRPSMPSSEPANYASTSRASSASWPTRAGSAARGQSEAPSLGVSRVPDG
jgi:hypothetical protein